MRLAQIRWNKHTIWLLNEDYEGEQLTIYRSNNDEVPVKAHAFALGNPFNYTRFLEVLLNKCRLHNSFSSPEVAAAIIKVQNAFTIAQMEAETMEYLT